MGTQTYDPSKTSVIVATDELEGFAPDSFIEATPGSPRYTLVQCCEGQVVRTASRDQSGTVKVVLLPTSPSNATLDGYRLLDDKDGSGVFALQVKDDSAGVSIHADQAWVAELPRLVVSGSGLQMREWTIACAAIDWDYGGADDGFSLSGLLGAAVGAIAGALHLPFPV